MSETSNESVVAIETTLAGVEKALDRLRDGSYRLCEQCQTPISAAALSQNPLRVTCDAHLELA